MVTDNRRDLTELWYRASAKNVVIFALMWLGAAFLTLMFVKWVIHAALYLLLVPWALLGSTTAAGLSVRQEVLPLRLSVLTSSHEQLIKSAFQNL